MISVSFKKQKHRPLEVFGLKINKNNQRLKTIFSTLDIRSFYAFLRFYQQTRPTSVGVGRKFEAVCFSVFDEVIRRIALTRDCMKALDRNIWRSSITTATKIRLYSAYILPVLLYGAETWTLTKVVSKKIDSFDLCDPHTISIISLLLFCFQFS